MTHSSSADDRSDLAWSAEDVLPPARGASPDSGIGGLPPVPSSRLVGRDKELEFVLSACHQRSTQLLTILGPGGVGKTRLALTAAWELAPSFDDGVVFIRFTESDPQAAWETIAMHLETADASELTLPAAIREALRPQNVLLVLDHCEHVTDVLSELHPILADCPGVYAIVTSQEALGVTGEQELWLHPLALPPDTSPLTVDAVAASSAVQVFVARAHRRDSSFALGEDIAADIAAIVRLLDGLPLALELAAAQMRHLSPAALRQRLECALPSLAGGSRDLPDSQRSLLGMTEWSLNLLSDEDRDRFLQLAVLLGNFTPEMGATIAGISPVAGWELLISFADKSLVKRVVARKDTSTRFFMLQTVHAVALHLLQQRPEQYFAASTRHAAAFLALAREAAMHWHGPDHLAWLERMEQEHANITLVIDRALNEPRLVQMALELAEPMFWFWYSRGYVQWALPRIEQLLNSAPDTLPPHVRGAAHVTAGWLAFKQTQVLRARHHFREGVRRIPNPASPAALRGMIGDAYTLSYKGENTARAIGILRQVTKQAASNPDAWHEMVAGHFGLGLTGYFDGQLSLARTGFEESLQIARARGDHQSTAMSLLYLAHVDRAKGSPSAAIRKLQDVVPIFLDIGDQTTIALSLDAVVSTLVDLNERPLASRIAEVVEQIRHTQGIPRSPLEQADLDNAMKRAGMAHLTLPSPGLSSMEDVVDAFLHFRPEPAQPDARDGPIAAVLSARELEVLRLIAEGRTSPQIAEALFLSPHTVKRHMANIRLKLGVRSQAAAVAALQRSQLKQTG